MSDQSQSQSQSQSSSSDQPPSLLSSHVKYAQGALSSTLSSDPSSGEQTKAAAVEEMKAASAARHSESGPAQSGVLGTVEQKAGEIAGCEGMVGEGAERKGE